ncbi:hypothetical protein BGZ95_008612, partial [Linnemannia exigua]
PKKPTTKAHKSKTTTTKAHKATTTTKVHTTKVHTTTTTPSSKPTTSPKPKPGKVGQTGTIVDQKDFCIFNGACLANLAGWVQITGRIDRSKYGLSPKDGGGQYDMRAPVGATYSGFNAFVQLTEPDSGIYCIRACMTKADCPVNKSTHGCVRVLGGDYS